MILDRHPSWKSKVDFVSVADVAADGAFEGVFRERAGEGGNGFDYVVHAASSINFYATDFQKELIDPTIAGYVPFLLLNFDGVGLGGEVDEDMANRWLC